MKEAKNRLLMVRGERIDIPWEGDLSDEYRSVILKNEVHLSIVCPNFTPIYMYLWNFVLWTNMIYPPWTYRFLHKSMVSAEHFSMNVLEKAGLAKLLDYSVCKINEHRVWHQ